MNLPAVGLLLQSKASQTELRGLRGELNAARAEVTVAQSDLVAVRTEEARKRELKAEQSKTDKTLGEGCATFSVRQLFEGQGRPCNIATSLCQDSLL